MRRTAIAILPLARRIGNGAWRIIRTWGPWLVILWPVWAVHALIREHQVNAPFLDDFMSIPLFEKAARGTLTWHDFFAPQMEHRIAWPRVVLLFFYKAWPHDFTRQVWFSYGLLCLTLVNVGILLKQTAASAFRSGWPVLALASVALFSPVQFQVLLWPFMHQVVGLAFFLTGALAVWQSHWPAWLRFIVSALFALCATLSFTAGILIWLVLVPVIWWCAPKLEGRSRPFVTGLWLAAFALTIAMYFHGLKNEVDPAFSLGQGNEATMGRDLKAFVADPGKSLDFAVRVLGGPLARDTTRDLLDASWEYGMLLVVLYAASAGYFVRRFRDEDVRRRLLPWLALGAYSIGTVLAISMGRVWVTRSGINALSGRYLIHAVPLMIAIPALVWLIARDLGGKFPQFQPAIRQALLASVVAVIFCQAANWSYGVGMMDMWSSSRLRAAVNMMFYKTKCTLEYDIDALPDLARRADDLGLLRPPMLGDSRLDHFHLAPHPLNPIFADWTSLRFEKGDDGLQLECHGFARLQKYPRVADGVFLTYQAPEDGHWEIFRVVQVTGMPLYLSASLRKDLEYTYSPPVGVRESLSSFDAKFKPDDLPKGVIKVAAWAFDYREQKVYLIPGFYEVDTNNGTVKDLGKKSGAINFSSLLRQRKKPVAL